MEYPIFIYHELIIRLREIEPNLGSFSTVNFQPDHCVIFTSAGSFRVGDDLLEKQYRDPKTIGREHLQDLLADFQKIG
jgi:hypothetical protein